MGDHALNLYQMTQFRQFMFEALAISLIAITEHVTSPSPKNGYIRHIPNYNKSLVY